jgi:drug/metabolite transporter (DMT)-like permease
VFVQFSSIIVPVVEAMLLRQAPSLRLSVSSILSMAGVGVLSRNGGGATGRNILSSFRAGDLMVLSAAVAYSAHITRLSQLAPRLKSPLRLAALKSATQLLLSINAMAVFAARRAIWGKHAVTTSRAAAQDHSLSGPLFAVALWNGAVCTGFTMWAQGVGQTHVKASEAALIYATQPIWGAAFSALLVGERPTLRELRGLGLLFAAMFLSLSGGRGSIGAAGSGESTADAGVGAIYEGDVAQPV